MIRTKSAVISQLTKGTAVLLVFLLFAKATPVQAHCQTLLSAWGSNAAGQLGNNTYADSLQPVQVAIGMGAEVVRGGFAHTVVLKQDGTVFAWGSNQYGQIGNTVSNTSPSPLQVMGPGGIGNLTGITAITSGYYHCVALRNDGTLWAWGRNNAGQLGDGTNTDRKTPVQVVDSTDATGFLTGVIAVSAGANHTLALKADGTVRAWGFNSNGQLGVGSTLNKNAPVAIAGLGSVVALAGGDAHSLALLGDGTVRSWGFNSSGQLGNGNTFRSLTPVQVLGVGGVGTLGNIVSLACGSNHSLAITGSGTVLAWGNNQFGQLGNGQNLSKSSPVQVIGITNAVHISGGFAHTLASLADSTVLAWGYNFYGQLGDNTTDSRNLPGLVTGLPVGTTVSCGYYHSLGLSEPASISGVIAFDQQSESAPAQLVTFTLYPTDGANPVTRTVLVGPDGAFKLTDLIQNEYILRAKGTKFLRAKNPDPVDIRACDVDNVKFTLLGGDANDDNTVNFDDFGILADAYFTQKDVDPLYDERADFNGDSEVNFDDFLILANNYFLVGD